MNIALILFKYSVDISDPCCYPLGFMYVCSWLKAGGHTVEVFNENIGDPLPDYTDFDVVCMTGFEEFLPRIKEVAAECKRLGVTTWLGGALATFEKDKMKEIVDDVFMGEIERGIIDIWPDYEAFGVDKYHEAHAVRYMGVLTSRGCPFNCSFCAHTCNYSERDLSDVFDEILFYKAKYDVEMIVFYDNTFNVKKDRFMEICYFMRRENLRWSAALRADVFDEEMAKAMEVSGGEYCIVGVESFRQCKLDAMHKHITVKQIRNTLDLLHKHGIRYHGNVILGLHGDTMESIVKEVEEIPREYNLFPVLAQPFVGTAVESDLLPEQRVMLNNIFRNYAESKGMTVFGGLT